MDERCEKADNAGFLSPDEGESEPGRAYSGMAERLFVRLLMGAVLCMALLAFVLVPVPEDVKGNPTLPGPAFGQTGLYRMEVALFVLYGSLLLMTPAFVGLVRGRLPIEVSTRGAKFAEEADLSGGRGEAKFVELEQKTSALTERLAAVNVEIERLKDASRSDSTQPEVDSKL